jgi:hypothetical protein
VRDGKLNGVHVAISGSVQKVGCAPHRSALVKGRQPTLPPHVVPRGPHLEKEVQSGEVAGRKGKAHGLYDFLRP